MCKLIASLSGQLKSQRSLSICYGSKGIIGLFCELALHEVMLVAHACGSIAWLQIRPGLFRYLKPTIRALSSRGFHSTSRHCDDIKERRVINKIINNMSQLDSLFSSLPGSTM